MKDATGKEARAKGQKALITQEMEPSGQSAYREELKTSLWEKSEMGRRIRPAYGAAQDCAIERSVACVDR